MKKTPVAVIGFLREDVLRKTLLHLASAEGCFERDIYLYLAPPRSEADKAKTDSVLAMAEKIKKEVLPNLTIVKREQNQGCSLNVRFAIQKTLEICGRAIIIEEDILVSKTCLRYFDEALETYKDDKRVWCVNGYKNPFLKIPKAYPYDVLLNPRNMAWGWATWLDRWESTNFGTDDWPQYKQDPGRLARLVEVGADVPAMLEAVHMRGANAWDAQCTYHMAKHNLYAVEPIRSLTKNIGFKTEGAVHCSRPHGYYEKQKYYDFVPRLVSVDMLLGCASLMKGRFMRTVQERRLIPFAYRCVMRVIKHYIGPNNDEPITL